jgi:hypothetical protein
MFPWATEVDDAKMQIVYEKNDSSGQRKKMLGNVSIV